MFKTAKFDRFRLVAEGRNKHFAKHACDFSLILLEPCNFLYLLTNLTICVQWTDSTNLSFCFRWIHSTNLSIRVRSTDPTNLTFGRIFTAYLIPTNALRLIHQPYHSCIDSTNLSTRVLWTDPTNQIICVSWTEPDLF